MKVAYIHTTDLGSQSTSANFVVYNALSLAEHADILLILVNNSNNLPEKILEETFGVKKLPEKLKVKTYRSFSKSKILFYLKASWNAWVSSKVDSVITRTHGILPYLFLLRRNRSTILFETHDFFYDLSERRNEIKRPWRKKSHVEGRYFKKLDGLICLNSIQKELYRKHLTKIPIRVLTTGLNEYQSNQIRTKKQVVYVGSLNKRLGLGVLKSLVEKMPDLKVRIVGGRDQEELGYLNSIFGSELPENLSVTGWISKEQVLREIDQSEIALLPLSDTYFNKYLTVPLKLLDYISCSTPVVAADMPSIRELIKNDVHGFLIDWDQEDLIIEKVKYLLDNPQVREKMRNNMKVLADRLTWEKRAVGVFEFLKSLDR